MKRLAALLIPIMAGCQIVKSVELDQAMSLNDLNAAREVFISPQTDSQTKSRALSYLSDQYAAELMSNGDDALVTAKSLNDLCIERIKHECNHDALSALQKEETRRRNERKSKLDEAQARAIAEQEESKRIVSDISSGKRKITTLNDARVYFSPIKGGGNLMVSPKVSGGDGKYYEMQTYLTGRDGSVLISWLPDTPYGYTDVLAGAVFPSPKYVQEGIAFGGPITVVGKYVDNQEITLVSGRRVVVPVFSDSYIFGPR